MIQFVVLLLTVAVVGWLVGENSKLPELKRLRRENERLLIDSRSATCRSCASREIFSQHVLGGRDLVQETEDSKARAADLELRYLHAASLLSGVTVIGPNPDGFSVRAAILDPDELWKQERDDVLADPLVAEHIDPSEFQIDGVSISDDGGGS